MSEHEQSGVNPYSEDAFDFLEKALADAGMEALSILHDAQAEHTAIELDERAKPCMGRVAIVGVIDDPGAPDHGQVVTYASNNTITFDARDIMAHALAGDLQGVINGVAWGDGTSEPKRENTQLDNELAVTAISQVSYPPGTGSVVFSSTMPPQTNTGMRFSEVGLMSPMGMLARFKFPAQEKFERLRLSVNWQIIFV